MKIIKKIIGIIVLFSLAAIFLNTTNIFAQASGSLIGKITDKVTNEGIFAANIILKQNGQNITGGSVTFDGTYNISPIPLGIYEVEVMNGPCFFIKKRKIEIKSGEETNLDFQLELDFTLYYGEVEIPPHNSILFSSGYNQKEIKMSSITGKVTDKLSKENVKGTKIALRSSSENYLIGGLSRHDGTYNITSIYPDTSEYNIEVGCSGYITETIKMKIKEDKNIELDFQLIRDTTPLEYVAVKTDAEMPSISGKITYKDTEEKVIGTNIIFMQNKEFIAASKTSFYGTYNIEHIPAGTYEIIITLFGHIKKKTGVEIKTGENKILDIQL